MTVKDFKEYTKRGLGRSITELKTCNNIEKYRKAVLECCLKNISFDAQTEGARAWYLHELVSFYNDDDYFLLPVIEKFKGDFKNGWDFYHFSQLLMEFALEGNQTAINALWDGYGRIYIELSEENHPHGYNVIRHCFESVSISLTSVEGLKAFLKIAADMGKLFTQCHCKADDFEWFFINFKDKAEDTDVDEILTKESKNSPHIKAFYENMLECFAKTDEIIKDTSAPKRNIKKFKDEKQAGKSEKIRSDTLDLIKKGDRSSEVICALIANYCKEDKELLLGLLNSMKITYSDSNGWHSVVGALLEAFEENTDLPKEALYFIYEKSLCSACRFYAVTEMAKRSWLTDGIKEECLCDSDYDIYEYVQSLK